MHIIFMYVDRYLLWKDSMYESCKHAQADLNFIEPSHIFQTAMKKNTLRDGIW